MTPGGRQTPGAGAHPDREQSAAAGKTARQRAPLASQRDFCAPPSRDPVGLLHRIAIAAYLGRSDKFDQAIAEFAETYADQTEADHAALADAVSSGRVQAQMGI